MKDIHKKLMERSFDDAFGLAIDFEEEYKVQIPPEMVGNAALHLYQHRVEKHRMKKAKAEQESLYPDDGSPNQGRY